MSELQNNIHSISGKLLTITEGHHGYKERLRRALDIVLSRGSVVEPWPWKEFESDYNATGMHRTYKYETFHDYLKQWCKFTFDELCKLFSDDAAMLSKLDEAVKDKHGGDRRSPNFKIDNINVDKVPDGTSKQAALRRLRKDRPDLHQRVLDGDLSAHAAMLDAGLRRKSITVTDSNPATAAARIRATFGDDFAEELKRCL